MRSTPRRYTATAAVGALALFLAACGGDADSDTDGTAASTESAEAAPVRVMMYTGQVYRLPVIVAESEGFFADRGIELEIVEQPGNLQGTQGLEATESQVGQISVSTLGQGWQSGADVAFFCGGLDVIQTSLMVKPDSDLPSVEDGASWQEVLQALEGKTIGIQTPVGSGVQLLFAEALQEAGVTDVTYVNVGTAPATVQASLQNGSVDVIQTNPPVTQFMLNEGVAEELLYLPSGPSAYQDLYGSGWVAPTQWLEESPEVAADFCDAVEEGLAFIQDDANAEESARLLQEDGGIAPEVASLVVGSVFEDFSTEVPRDRMESTLQTYVDLGVLKADPAPTYDELVVDPNG